MFEIVESISHFLRDPFMNVATRVESIPILFALLLGLVGALAPCQFSGNVSAITLYGTNSLKQGIAWRETLFFILGKITAFSGLGLVIYLLGQEFQQQLPLLFEPMRKLIGPLLIFIGVYMLGLFKMTWHLRLWKPVEKTKGKGHWGAFMLGFSFSLGFCPTMAILYFSLLIPLTLTTAYGVFLPPLFALGTSIPLLIVIFIIWYLGFGGMILKKGRRLGLYVQRTAGILIILIGIMDVLTFW
ncbi:sulfite exporter TauE/SafE family protein [Salipaludibacillus agaradhaerens]|jgi:cytochrome c biogenesis protein CcdA|uniref:Sulfite exporter TauE/SafE family protein n=1 Tax=Salipaludibacillus agaradhaerens TaxID=76935 RepID=A0A9Q4B2C5_SALAG|nr:sulfite exporter TauE/SafE family protein [Salipaludibacillus agaradhaerens]MCR6097044.1 sulfite exporter TauE/SafE family protein [Salipaludibacillus agaradhaerens]MCR6113471.1 sulfite exporter TauE/SafE family protein [Salipaludibacillus agaradhaerens]